MRGKVNDVHPRLEEMDTHSDMPSILPIQYGHSDVPENSGPELTERNINLSSFFAFSNASAPHSYQSTCKTNCFQRRLKKDLRLKYRILCVLQKIWTLCRCKSIQTAGRSG